MLFSRVSACPWYENLRREESPIREYVQCNTRYLYASMINNAVLENSRLQVLEYRVLKVWEARPSVRQSSNKHHGIQVDYLGHAEDLINNI